jgi:hypothetical protein
VRGVRKSEPSCVDCPERDPSKFYAHPTSATGRQSRCKACDNRNRINRKTPKVTRERC